MMPDFLANAITATFPASWFAGLALLALAVAVLHCELRARKPRPRPTPGGDSP